METPPGVADQIFQLNENSSAGTLVGQISVENNEHTDLSYNLVRNEFSYAFTIDSSLGLIYLIDSSVVDYETNTELQLEVMVGYVTVSNSYALFPKVTIQVIDQPEESTLVISSSTGNSFDGWVSSLEPALNFAGNAFLYADCWTKDLIENTRRSYLYFDLSVLPNDAEILNATLYLYHPNDSLAGHLHSQLTGANEFIIAPVLSSWREETLTWDNQPIISNSNKLEIGATTSNNQSFEIDLTNIIKEASIHPNAYYGISLRLKQEYYYKRICFASFDNINAEQEPKLQIKYSN